MTIEEMKKKKTELGYSNEMLSKLSGVPLGTLQKIFAGQTKSPRYDTLQAIRKALYETDPAGETAAVFGKNSFSPQLGSGAAVRETSSYGSEQRSETGLTDSGVFSGILPDSENGDQKTIDDYIALPEGTRVELIDGKFYDMASPTTIHQAVGGEIHNVFKNFVRDNKGQCIPFTAPTDVQLDCDNKTMLQPDVLVVCDRKKITRARIVGAPDLVVEIISPSNVVTDVLIKMNKYRKAGVREYWIVFPEEKAVMVYDFSTSEVPVHYTFEDTVPVAIWDGRCRVNFKELYEQIRFMYENG